jgi:hypothetical protein
MSTADQREQEKRTEDHRRETLNALISEQVIHTLGRQPNLSKVQVRWLWENYYRVNIIIGEDAASVKVANSYFVQADSDGNIVESTPKIIRCR